MRRILIAAALLCGCTGTCAFASDRRVKPDVLFIVVDDMNDWISLLDPDAAIQTPNLERLAARGTLFTRAYCVSAACNPSRAATLTGLRPSTTGAYGNKSDWRTAVGDRPTLMRQFRQHGYDVRGAGKIFHHHLNGAFHDTASFDEFQPMRDQKYPTKKLNGAATYGSRNTDWGQWPQSIEESIDAHTADYCISAIASRSDDRPLFLACGIFKPHSPFFAPAVFHQPYMTIALPSRKSDDWADLPSGAIRLLRNKTWFYDGMMKVDKRLDGSYRDFVRSYAACASFADHQIGRVLDALDESGRAANTIIVLWSDHGFHLGEKNHIEKFALWEKSNHIPFIVVAPGVTTPGSRCDHPIDLTTVYPTLLELAGLPKSIHCDGPSIVPLLQNPTRPWKRPAVMTYLPGNHAVRSHRWRYIRYADGSEELYDHQNDPNEWHNLASDPMYLKVIANHRTWIPKTEARVVSDLKTK